MNGHKSFKRLTANGGPLTVARITSLSLMAIESFFKISTATIKAAKSGVKIGASFAVDALT